MTDTFDESFKWLPEEAFQERIPLTKAAMMANMASGKGEVRLIRQHVRSSWVLSLRPDNVGMHAYYDEHRAYSELLVIGIQLSEMSGERLCRFQEMCHRAIPYPLFLWLKQDNNYFLSAVPLRHSRAEKSKDIWDGPLTRTQCAKLDPAFLAALRPTFSPEMNLRDLYLRWLRALYGLMINSLPWERILGRTLSFFLPDNIDEAVRIWTPLAGLCADWKSLDSQLAKERQPNRRVELGNRRFELREQILRAAATFPGFS